MEPTLLGNIKEILCFVNVELYQIGNAKREEDYEIHS